MGDYFKPWQRKLGVLTLVMGCVAMGGWVRGQIITDIVMYPVEKHRFDCLISATNAIVWQRQQLAIYPDRREAGSETKDLAGTAELFRVARPTAVGLTRTSACQTASNFSRAVPLKSEGALVQ